ncbi:hypothetical protein FQA39_LY09281 [Lamprigera yunnana]|nr:hypothetical protein FQA39_LY09281 [Lamprigera yunnana]
MAIALVLIVLLLLILLIQYNWKRRHLYKLASILPGPFALPIIGNGWKFICKDEDILEILSTMSKNYRTPVRFWFGPLLVVLFTYPEHIEKILSSTKLVHKHDVYDLFKIYVGDGLLSNSGEKYKKHKRLIQPFINLKFTINHIENIQKHINIYMCKLSKYCNGPTFDIHDLTHDCFADIVGEAILGTQINSQHGKNLDYIHASIEMYAVGYSRLMRPWLHPNIIYNNTSGKLDQDRITTISYNFIKDKVLKSFNRVRLNASPIDETNPIIDQIANLIQNDPSLMNDTDFIYHMYTIYCAAEDTMTTIISILCVCLGMYPDYQKNAIQEINLVCGVDDKPVSYDQLSQLNYLDMCVRDVLRLIPMAPFIVRKTLEDFRIGDIVIPKDCGIAVSIFDAHRNPKHWENPNDFYPDHFLPEAVAKRHPYAFIPFSAGPRNCVGKVFAMIVLKLVMVNILRHFEIEADGKFCDIVLKSDISVRSQSGYKVRLRKRHY